MSAQANAQVGGKLSLKQRLAKAMDKAGKQTSKALVKGKILAIQKMTHAEVSPEVPEITGALERLKATKNEISALADVARYLYEARINQANYQIEMSHQLRECRTADADGWSKLAVAMGNSLSRLESIHSEHCDKMKEEFVAPIEKFRDVNINDVQKLKLKYKEAKSAYDVAIAKERAAKETGQAPKMSQAFSKKQETESTLKQMREHFVKAVESLEREKNTELLGLVLDYWNKYLSFAKAQYNGLLANPLPNDIDPTNYKPPMFATLTPGSGAETDPEFGGPEFVTNFNESQDEQKSNAPGSGSADVSMGAAAAAGIAVVGVGAGAAVVANNNGYGDIGGGDDYNQNNNNQGGYDQGGYDQGGYDQRQVGYDDGTQQQHTEQNEYNQQGYDENQGGYDEHNQGYDENNGYNENQGYDDGNQHENGGYDENNNQGYDENGQYDDNNINNEQGGYDENNQGYENGVSGVNGGGALPPTNPFEQDANGGDPLDFDPYQQQ